MVVLMKSMSLKTAEAIADAAIHTAIQKKWAPITVVVLDAWGHTIVSKRMDGCSPVGIPQFAHAKANSCIIMRTPLSSTLSTKYTALGQQSKISQLHSMVTLSSDVGGMAPFPGGALISNTVKNVLTGEEEMCVHGAVGVSGAAGEEDEQCAIQGVKYYQDAGFAE